MTTNSFSTRINDHALSFGMIRYSTGNSMDDKHLWKLVISDFCGTKTHTSIEVTVSDFEKIKAFCEKAIGELKTDGGRL